MCVCVSVIVNFVYLEAIERLLLLARMKHSSYCLLSYSRLFRGACANQTSIPVHRHVKSVPSLLSVLFAVTFLYIITSLNRQFLRYSCQNSL